jgi:hypothetical protein
MGKRHRYNDQSDDQKQKGDKGRPGSGLPHSEGNKAPNRQGFVGNCQNNDGFEAETGKNSEKAQNDQLTQISALFPENGTKGQFFSRIFSKMRIKVGITRPYLSNPETSDCLWKTQFTPKACLSA